MTDEIDEDLLDDIDVEEHLENAIDGDEVRDPINADEPEVELDAEHDELDDIPDRDEIEEGLEEIRDVIVDRLENSESHPIEDLIEEFDQRSEEVLHGEEGDDWVDIEDLMEEGDEQ